MSYILHNLPNKQLTSVFKQQSRHFFNFKDIFRRKKDKKKDEEFNLDDDVSINKDKELISELSSLKDRR